MQRPYHGPSSGTASDSLGRLRPLANASATPPCRAEHDLQPWTAARCHRLLRQLQSRLVILRKLAMECRALPHRPLKRDLPLGGEPAPSKRIRFTYGGRRRPTATETPSIVGSVTPPRPIRTLGAMKLDRSSPASGRVDISTPAWRRIRDQPDTPHSARRSPSQAQQYEHETSFATLTGEMRSLRQAVTEEKFRIYETIFGWLNGVLRSTMSEDGEPHRDSLLGMCLRKVPACVANIEAFERQQKKERGHQSMWDDSNVSFELYGQLEELGSSRSGWRPLKLAVRSHAMSLLSQAASEGLLDDAFTGLLTRLCLHLGCANEAKQLAESADALLPPPVGAQSKLTESERLLSVRHVLESLQGKRPLHGKKAPGAALSCISTLMQGDLLPVDWLSTHSFASLWASSLEIMTARRSGASVTAFMSTCLPLLALAGRGKHCPQQPSNTEQTLISVAAGLVAAAMAVTNLRGKSQEHKRRRAWRRVVFVLSCCVAELRRHRRRHGGRDNGLFMFALARHLTLVDAPFASLELKQQARAELIELARKAATGNNCSQSHYRQTILLLCSIAQHRSRSCAMPGRDSVTEACANLDDLALSDVFGRSLRTDVAFLLAQRTKDLRDLAFAESLPTAEEPARVSTIFSGWRWEEGISEWVLPTEGAEARASCPDTKKPGVPVELSEACSNRQRSRNTQSAATAIQKATTASTGKMRRRNPSLTMYNGKENSPWAAAEASPRQRRGSVSLSRQSKVRRVSGKVLGLLPTEDDWDDLI